ncbi:hypothetical protein ACHAW6_000612 [Cyclotella cf. meneghiniana]
MVTSGLYDTGTIILGNAMWVLQKAKQRKKMLPWSLG